MPLSAYCTSTVYECCSTVPIVYAVTMQEVLMLHVTNDAAAGMLTRAVGLPLTLCLSCHGKEGEQKGK